MIKWLVNFQEKVFLSELIHFDYLIPVLSHFLQTFTFSQVNKGENIFFETTTTETDRWVQKLISNSGIRWYALSDFTNVSVILFTNDSDWIDWWDSLGKETVCCEFWQLGRGVISINNALLADIFVKCWQSANISVFSGAQNDTIWFHQIVDCSTLSQEFRIAGNNILVPIVLNRSSFNNSQNHFESSNGYSRFLNKNDILQHWMLVVIINDISYSNFSVAKIIGFSFLLAKVFSRCG